MCERSGQVCSGTDYFMLPSLYSSQSSDNTEDCVTQEAARGYNNSISGQLVYFRICLLQLFMSLLTAK